jgi:hypothetical protein
LVYIAKDLEYVSDAEFTEVVNGLLEISKMINGLMSYLKTTEMKGSKFMEDAATYGKTPL